MSERRRLKVRVTTGTRSESIREVDGVLVVGVREKPERGEANERVRALIARFFHVAPQKVLLVNGHTRKNKIFEMVQ